MSSVAKRQRLNAYAPEFKMPSYIMPLIRPVIEEPPLALSAFLRVSTPVVQRSQSLSDLFNNLHHCGCFGLKYEYNDSKQSEKDVLVYMP